MFRESQVESFATAKSTHMNVETILTDVANMQSEVLRTTNLMQAQTGSMGNSLMQRELHNLVIQAVKQTFENPSFHQCCLASRPSCAQAPEDQPDDDSAIPESREKRLPRSSRRLKMTSCSVYRSILMTVYLYTWTFLDSFGMQQSETRIVIVPKLCLSSFALCLTTFEYGCKIARKVRYHPIVSPDSLVFDVCRSGNLDALQTLFRGGLAGPWDTDPVGYTPLHVRQLLCANIGYDC